MPIFSAPEPPFPPPPFPPPPLPPLLQVPDTTLNNLSIKTIQVEWPLHELCEFTCETNLGSTNPACITISCITVYRLPISLQREPVRIVYYQLWAELVRVQFAFSRWLIFGPKSLSHIFGFTCSSFVLRVFELPHPVRVIWNMLMKCFSFNP